MDLSTIIGIIAGAAIIVNGIGLKEIGNFWDPPSVIIVIGGTFAALVASFPLSVLKNIPKHLKIIMNGKRFNNETCIDSLVDFAQEARKNGLLALEQKAEELEDPFFKYAIMLIVDAHDPADVRTLLNDELDFMVERHDRDISFYDKGSSLAPSFGMIGTLVGLINMLKGLNLSEGASDSLGKDMSTALVTTFYGCILANLIFSPLAKMLAIRNDEEYLYKQLIIEGVLSIQAGDNPKFLREKLFCYLSERVAQKAEEGGEGDAEKGKKKKSKGKKKKEE